MERHVAINGVCAWPNLTLLPDGIIVAMVYNQPNHLEHEGGDLECWASTDGSNDLGQARNACPARAQDHARERGYGAGPQRRPDRPGVGMALCSPSAAAAVGVSVFGPGKDVERGQVLFRGILP